LKFIDESLSRTSTKSAKAFTNLLKKDQDWTSAANEIRANIKLMTTLLDQLDKYRNRKSLLLDYLFRLKEKIHKPFADAQVELATLNVERSKGVVAATKALTSAKDSYSTCRKSAVLQKLQKLKFDAEDSERILEEMSLLLREEARHAVALSVKGSAVAVASGMSREDHQAIAALWPTFLIQLLSCTLSEFLVRCGNQSTVEMFASSLLELQNSIGKVLQPAGSSAETSGVKDGADSSSKYEIYVSKLSVSVTGFDVELFAAYIKDWRTRVQAIDLITGTSEFETAYKALSKSRSDLLKASEEYKRQSSSQEKHIVKFNNLRRRLIALKAMGEKVRTTILLCYM